MKILMLTSRFWPFHGGVEKHVEQVAMALQDMGHTVLVLTLTCGRTDLRAYEVHNGIEVFRINAQQMNRTAQVRAIVWAAQNRKILREVDIIHGHDAILKALLPMAPKAHQYLTFHGFEGYPVLPSSIESKQKMLQQVRGTICAGAFIGKWYNVRCDIVEWGAATQSPSDVEPITSDLCFVGRLEEDTGARVYIEAFEKLYSKNPALKMIVCGTGSLEEELHNFVAEKKLQVQFVGYIADPSPYYSGTKVACVSGYLAILEAMIRKVRVACYYDTPIKEDYLRMAPYADKIAIENTSTGLATTIENLLVQHTAGDVTELYTFAAEHTWQKLAAQYLELYATT